MKRTNAIAAVAFMLGGIAWGQPTPGVVVVPGAPPGGVGAACSTPAIGYLNTTTGCLATCVSAVWTCGGGGSSGSGPWTRTGTDIAPTNAGDTVTIGTTVSVIQTALATPAAPAISNQGTPGSTTYGYTAVAYNVVGRTPGSVEATTATGNATLDSSNFNRITPVACVSGQTGWMIYRSSGPSFRGLLGPAACGATIDDKGSLTNSVTSVPTDNLTVGAFGSYAHVGPSETTLDASVINLSPSSFLLTGFGRITMGVEADTTPNGTNGGWGIYVNRSGGSGWGIESDVFATVSGTFQIGGYEALPIVNTHITWAFGYHAEAPTYNATVTNAAGVYVQGYGDTNVTNAYGIYIEEQRRATNNFGLYVDDLSQAGSLAIRTGPGIVYHGDTVKIDLNYWDFGTHQAITIIKPNDQTANLLDIFAADGTTKLTSIGPSGITKASSGTRFVCIDTAGLLASSSSACSGT